MRCPVCKGKISCATPYENQHGEIIECCWDCAKKNGYKVTNRVWYMNNHDGSKTPCWKANIPTLKD